ncbi:MAG: nickel pincer cofactor biosynthesis protein LarB [Eggerthellaceae bacterium]|jgi:NCAIR mutase (PurE)-related protein
MEIRDLKELLAQVQDGRCSVDRAVDDIRAALESNQIEDLGYARVDMQRGLRQGASEIIYGQGKTADQIAGICRAQLEHGQQRILITRLSPDKAAAIPAELSLEYRSLPHLGIVGGIPEPDGIGTVVVATGGTSDLPVAEEAAVTAEMLGNRVTRLYDVGVAGIHRLLSQSEVIAHAQVIVAVAGMEGALASVIGGLASCPVIAVPTSVGYGANFGGLSALLSMLNSCASGVSVVNIDNGFGAGYQASLINHVHQA